MREPKPRVYESKLDRLRAELVRAEAVVKSLEVRKKDTAKADLEVERQLEKLRLAEKEAAEGWK